MIHTSTSCNMSEESVLSSSLKSVCLLCYALTYIYISENLHFHHFNIFKFNGN